MERGKERKKKTEVRNSLQKSIQKHDIKNHIKHAMKLLKVIDKDLWFKNSLELFKGGHSIKYY